MAMFTRYRQPKLLILYASYGEGHVQAARAIRDALEEQGNYRTVLIDLMAESHPWLNEMTRKFYLKSYTSMPALYGWMYDVTRPMKHNSLFGGFLHSIGRDKIKRLIAEEQPDAVIHTFPLFALPALKQKPRYRASNPPSYAVITDFDLHRRWVHPGIDRYYVPTDDLKQELGSLGIRPSRVQVSGIPLKRGFRSVAPDISLYRKFGLDAERPTILLMAGAHGVMPDIAKLCAGLLEQHDGVQIALVCGRNRKLQQQIASRFKQHPHADRLRLFGFVEQIHELMSLSTCLVTKPGGVTLSEAIAAGLPIFIYRPVPGQEKQNAVYLQSKGAAVICYKPAELIASLLGVINDPERLMNSRACINRLQLSDASADSIARDILTQLGAGQTLSSAP
ncbi:glycosyltransferase [Paenibacillus sp. NEAU-GSW1]|uniref:MGDG synthase family glycosyltransferase n=1 Tax=Paenibacillus sp. NEAU-GSW1 TaxID=2682486 RepID=UPI0012E26182|nr:glycosyltransferase [Paenibacillus sp. NEAU-GSW1]MUT65988.1 glycosyltransferase [Paenibacillus sp. NEAU-GSW1]